MFVPAAAVGVVGVQGPLRPRLLLAEPDQVLRRASDQVDDGAELGT